jgi:hypothetical protein
MGSLVKSLNQRHFRIIDLAVLGRTNQEIAKELNMTAGQVGAVLKSPQVEHEFAIRRERVSELNDQKVVDAEDEVTKALREGAIAAARKLITAVNSPDESLAVRASGDVLDRAGYPKVQKQIGGGSQTTLVVTGGDIARLQSTLEMDNGRNIAAPARR